MWPFLSSVCGPTMGPPITRIQAREGNRFQVVVRQVDRGVRQEHVGRIPDGACFQHEAWLGNAVLRRQDSATLDEQAMDTPRLFRSSIATPGARMLCAPPANGTLTSRSGTSKRVSPWSFHVRECVTRCHWFPLSRPPSWSETPHGDPTILLRQTGQNTCATRRDRCGYYPAEQ
jgi:hypothetical protein